MKPLCSTGIQLSFSPSAGWAATVDFSTWDHAEHGTIEGSIGTRHYQPTAALAVDLALQSATAIGVTFPKEGGVEPTLYVDEDQADAGELPSDWRNDVAAQCARLGWKNIYA